MRRPPLSASQLREDPRRILLVEDDDGDALIVRDRLLRAWPELEIRRVAALSEAERVLPGESIASCWTSICRMLSGWRH